MSNAKESPRDSAFRMLSDFFRRGIWSDDILSSEKYCAGLDQRDRSLAVNIFTGVVQNYLYLDYCISRCSSREIKKIDLPVLIILRSGMYQILFLDRVPASAVVNEAVNISKTICPSASSFINAVLRKAAAQYSIRPDVSAGSDIYNLSVRYSCSEWFVKYLTERFGREIAEKYLTVSNSVPCTSLKINTCKISADEYKKLLAEKSVDYRESAYFADSVFVHNIKVQDIPGYNEGFFYVQDDSSKACVEAAGISSGNKILDACASPGGKSFASAVIMGDSGSILSCDISAKKVEKIHSGAERLSLKSIECAVKDAKVFDVLLENTFDVVLCDVPCSGMGVIRKKPEIKYKTYSEIERLPVIQTEILNNVSHYVKVGGTLVYSTCTVLKEENEDVVKRFVDCGNFELQPFSVSLFRSDSGMYTFLPSVDGTDGFFVAKMKRIQ